MAKTSFVNAELNTGTDTFGAWIVQTNNIIYEMGISVVTTSLDELGDNTIGNSFVTGTFGATNFVASTVLRGGSMNTTGLLHVGSDVTIDATDTLDNTAVTFTSAGSAVFSGTAVFNNSTSVSGAGASFLVASSVPTATLSPVTTLINGTNLTESVTNYSLAAATTAVVSGARFDLDTLIFDVTSATTVSGDFSTTGVGKTSTIGSNTVILSGLTTDINSSTSTTLSSPILVANSATSQTLTSPILVANSATSQTFTTGIFGAAASTLNLTSTAALTLQSVTWNSNFTNSTHTGTGFYHLTAPALDLTSASLTMGGAGLVVSSSAVSFTGATLSVSGTTSLTGNTTLSGATNTISGTTLNLNSTTSNFNGTNLVGAVALTTALSGDCSFGSSGKVITISGNNCHINSNATNTTGTLLVNGAFSTSSTASIGTDLSVGGNTNSTGLSTPWAITSGVSTGALNAVMGTGGGATWLLSGTSGGVFRGGIQILDSGGVTRYYTGADYFQFAGNTLTAGTFLGNLTGNAVTATKLATGRTLTFTGGMSGTSPLFDGSANITIPITVGTHSHAASDVSSGALASARMPYGTTHTSVAYGDHTHAGSIGTGGGTLTGDMNFANGVGIGLIDNGSPATTYLSLYSDTVSGSINLGDNLAPTIIHGSTLKYNADTIIHTGNYTGLVNHDLLTGFVANEHINHTSISIVTGNGLTGGGTIAATRTLSVVANTGITVGASGVSVNFAGTGTAATASKSDHTHTTTGITSGIFSISRIPVGTSSSTVSAGNHTHIGTYDNYGNWKLAASGTAGTSVISTGVTATITAGTMITATRSGSNITISHTDTSSVTNLATLTGATVVSSLTFDSRGHVTAKGTRNLTAGNIGAATSGHTHTGTYARVTGADTFTGGVTITPSVATVLGLSVNTKHSITNNSIEAIGDVVAFLSDGRLKTARKPLTEVLTRINNIAGFTYQFNQKAVDLGAVSNKDKRYVGVDAQSVQAVLPEAVCLAPFDSDENGNSISGENYLTVKYDKLAALLIEGIKELTVQNRNLENRIQQLENR